MGRTRDEFPAATKRVLANRVGTRCSNPDCQRTTSGPSSDLEKAVNIGVAAHITAPAPGAPRYDAGLSEEERKSAQNGIWLCQICAKLIDNDRNATLRSSFGSGSEVRRSEHSPRGAARRLRWAKSDS